MAARFLQERRGRHARGWNNTGLQLQGARLPPQHTLGTPLPLFLAERGKPSRRAALFPGRAPGRGWGESRLRLCHLPLSPRRRLGPTPLPSTGRPLVGQAGPSGGGEPAPPLPAVTSQARGPLPLSPSAGHPYLSIHRSAGSAGRPSSPPSTLSSGTGRADRSIVSAGWRQTGELKPSALAPRIGQLFSLDGEQYQGKFHPKNYWQASCKRLPVAQASTRQ